MSLKISKKNKDKTFLFLSSMAVLIEKKRKLASSILVYRQRHLAKSQSLRAFLSSSGLTAQIMDEKAEVQQRDII